MDTIKLIAAIAYIKLNILVENDILVMIEFEDGGGYKFNYRSMLSGTHYIDLTNKI